MRKIQSLLPVVMIIIAIANTASATLSRQLPLIQREANDTRISGLLDEVEENKITAPICTFWDAKEKTLTIYGKPLPPDWEILINVENDQEVGIRYGLPQEDFKQIRILFRSAGEGRVRVVKDYPIPDWDLKMIDEDGDGEMDNLVFLMPASVFDQVIDIFLRESGLKAKLRK